MSGVNSSAAATAAAAANAVEAAVAMELAALAADAKALQAMLMTGDIVQATVQPFNGLTDTLQIFGMRVAASLPPNVYPGDTLTVAVQGFQNDQVVVQVMSRTPPPNAPATQSPPPTTSTAAVPQETDSVELTRMPIPIIVGDEPEFPPVLPPAAAPPTAESETVATPPSSANAAAAAAAAADEEAAAQNTVVQTPAATTPQADYAQARPETLSVEARLAFARTTPVPPRAAAPQTSGTVPPPRPAPATSQSASTTGRAASPGPQSSASARPNPIAPPIAPRSPFAPIITPRPDIAPKTPQPIPGAPVTGRSTTMMPASQTRPQAAPTAEELLQDPVALLRALRIPQTPTTLTFAKLVTQQPEQVATALAALEDALPDSDDPRIQTLRALAGFVGNLDPESPTFTTQVTSYLTHVIEGPEQKLAMLIAQEQQPEAAAVAAAPAEEEAAPAPQTPAPPAPATTAATGDATVVAAHSAERIAAVDADLKTQLVSLLASANPESVLGESGAVLARNALTGMVASQLSAINAQQSQPGTWSFTVPVMVGQQMYPARIAVSRDKPEGHQSVSGDDFHIAFILDTKRLGTIAIDMHAVQRSVSVSVRTERPSAATTFKSALSKLGKRLEDMRYNVKALEAGTTRVKTPEPQAPVPSDSLSTTDNKA